MNLFPGFRSFLAAIALALTCGPAFADVSDLLFTVRIEGDGNVPTIYVTNNSPTLEINRFDLTIGNTAKNFDGDTQTVNLPPGGTLVNRSPVTGVRDDTISIVLDGFGPGETFSFTADVDSDFDPFNTVENYSRVFFNNGSAPNSVARVYSGSAVSEITLEDNAPIPYTFRGPNRRLTVSSKTEVLTGNAGEQVQGITLFRNGSPVALDGYKNGAGDYVITVAHGDRIQVKAPQEVFKDINSDYITGSGAGDTTELGEQAEERFVAIGMSVNDVPQTADPTNYNFEITGDTEIDVKWRHYYALTVSNDFSKTRSQEVIANTPWAGPLESNAAGNPSPPVSKQWIQRGNQPVLQIDGQSIDNFSHPGLDIRYVVKGFMAYGPPNPVVGTAADTARITNDIDIRQPSQGTVSTYTASGGSTIITTASGTIGVNKPHGLPLTAPVGVTQRVTISGSSISAFNREHEVTVIDANTFSIPVALPGGSPPTALGSWVETTYVRFFPFDNVEPRQQVPLFNMFGPGGVKYVWQIQYGVRVNADDPDRTALGQVLEVIDGVDFDRTVQDGISWFDPGARVKVVSQIQEPGPDGATLTGWVNGDGYYFANQGQIDPATGMPTSGAPDEVNGNPVASWIPPTPSSVYRGYLIPNLQRPVRTVWRYGADALLIYVTIGKHLFEDYPQYATMFTRPPEPVTDAVPDPIANAADGTPPTADQMTEYDAVAGRLFPTVPGRFTVPWKPGTESETPIEVRVTATLPFDADRQIRGHYPHVNGTPAVALDPDPDDALKFKSIKYTNAGATVDAQKHFETTRAGMSVLLFSDIQSVGRGQPREFLKVRVVDTREWNARLPAAPTSVPVGSKILDTDADAANLGTGYVLDLKGRARYNPFVYDASKLSGLASRDLYDMDKLRADSSSLEVVNRAALPGPVIPVNEHPGVADDALPIIVWYDDPRKNDTLLWPNEVRIYKPEWPDAAGMPQIVIASQFGSEGKSRTGADQITAPALASFPEATTYDPSRLQALQVYSQPDPTLPGYNPNEEHALIAPSLRFSSVSPRPSAVYALRDGDLNNSNRQVVTGLNAYTSHPFVLAQYFDVAADEVKMRAYAVKRQSDVSDTPQYRFASNFTATTNNLKAQPYVVMKAGEPVIPFYPLGVAIGASPAAETFGNNFFAQETYWEDWRGSYWAISGGDMAWFNASFYYPLAPDFWWPSNVSVPPIKVTKSGATYTPEYDSAGNLKIPGVGDAVAFLPSNVRLAGSSTAFSQHLPTKVIFKSEWPENPPILKAGETLTFSGGEYRADHPTSTVVTNGVATTVDTPGLPQLTAFASAEVVFDSVNPEAIPTQFESRWTARVVQALDKRTVALPVGKFPSALQPAGGKTRVDKGKYIFNELPASIQRRFRYDPLALRPVKNEDGTVSQVPGVLEFTGLLNDKDIGDATLTASPSAVYVLEPNILTNAERDAITALSSDAAWGEAVTQLYNLTRNPDGVTGTANAYLAGLMRQPLYNPDGSIKKNQVGDIVYPANPPTAQARAFGPGLALVPNGNFLDPTGGLPEVSYVTVVENNDASLGGAPITPHIIKVDRRERYRGSIKTILSDNVFDENIALRSTGDFGANADDLVFEWWYRPDDGSLNVAPPDLTPAGQTSPWKLFPDPSGAAGRGRYQITLSGNPNAPETLLADTHWFARYRHINDAVSGTNWGKTRPVSKTGVNYTWAGAGNSDPFNDRDLNGVPDFVGQLVQGWIKRVLDAVNPYEARIRDFEGDAPSTLVSMISQFGARYEGPVALNPAKNVIENVGLIELYETVLNRGRSLSIDLSRPVSTPAISNALQLASTRISDFYTLLGNEAYVDSLDPTIGVDSGSLSSSVFAFQNQLASPIDEELGLLRGVDDYFARPVYNRLFWNFTKAEGEAAYASNYNITDVNQDGFINEADAMLTYPQGHGDAWGHYLTALTNQYELLRHPDFNWVSRSESYNLQDIVITVDFLDERKFAAAAAQKAKAGAEIVSLTYRERYVADPNAQWQGYTDSNPDRAWGVDEWGRRAGQGAYFDWVTANALLPSQHPNAELEGIRKVDRENNADIAVISANLNAVQRTVDQADKGENPLGLARDAQMFDLDPLFLDSGSGTQGQMHFDQIYERAQAAIENASAAWDNANQRANLLREVGNSEEEFRNSTFQEDLAYRNRLIQIFGKPYEGTIGPGRLYPAGYEGPDLALYMYVPIREINSSTVPGPSAGYASFGGDGKLSSGTLFDAFNTLDSTLSGDSALKDVQADMRSKLSPTFASATNSLTYDAAATGLFDVEYTNLSSPKVELTNFVNQMPVTTAGYTFQAPNTWGARGATGELQNILNQMIRQEADVAAAIGDWDALTGENLRILHLLDARVTTSGRSQGRAEVFSRLKLAINNTIKIIETGLEIADSAKQLATTLTSATKDGIPLNLPTGGLSVSPGDALSVARLGIGVTGTIAVTGFNVVDDTLKISKLVAEIGIEVAENELELANADDARKLEVREWLKELEDQVGDEPIKRIAIFKEIQALRELSDQYRTLLDEGGRLVDERAAFNKRVAAQTQRKRYQDMTFRVARNHALGSYRSAFDLAARYAYLATSAYDYETNFATSDPASASGTYGSIIGARRIGSVDFALSQLKANYDSQRSQLGLNNAQREISDVSVRRELMRILPSGESQPDPLPAPGEDSDTVWRQQLQNARVPDLWQLSEFRENCRPFASATDAAGKQVPQPGIVLRFSTDISSGKNFFGKPLSGGDQAFSTSNYSTKILGLGVAFEGYRTDDILNDLPASPRIYFIPGGLDVMRVSRSDDPDELRMWKVVEQAIPVPYPATGSQLQKSGYIPLLDSLNGRLGAARRFSDFRAYPEEVGDSYKDSRLVGRSVWNTEWLLIIPGATLNADPEVGLDRFIEQVTDIKLEMETYGQSGG